MNVVRLNFYGVHPVYEPEHPEDWDALRSLRYLTEQKMKGR